ncbi:PREDICTED: peptidyl-alpha-hydroxyglycine alpha-amidating lyase 1-like [Diuraphis noxia]|uniref:peptidyl-alpha-hydroxyglycine alpha-amidating lyase 1-like n=1 Tax=Diuraphis noxia TaxID=143948 RepID=UPI00076356C8|nr:PREDICTED: peptidyl-alpha-hydroxyglycine alpha-amidating lyase 1-like [Diuraphis noxia]
MSVAVALTALVACSSCCLFTATADSGSDLVSSDYSSLATDDQQPQQTSFQLQQMASNQPYGQIQVDNIDNSNVDVFHQFHFHESSEWPFPHQIDNSIGQISGVSISKDNFVYIFHRGDREWNQTTFFQNNVYREKHKGPISEQVVVVLDPKNGSVIKRWGGHRFYMPHGITVDHENNVWLTDVALHQVFKFSPNSENVLMTFGTEFVPGNDLDKFCKPTSVAVTTSGEFYVADGYCNSRIIKFSAKGRVLLEWGRSTLVTGEMFVPPYQLWIPHALTLAEDKELICVADRENSRVLCFNTNNGTFNFEINPQLFQRIFSVAYSPVAGGLFYVLNDKNMDVITETLAQGIVINASTLEIIGKFHPKDDEFSRPHDMAVSPDGASVYVVELIRSHIRKFVLDSDIQNKFINKSVDTFSVSEQELMLNKYNVLENCPGLRENSGKQILVIMLIIAVGLFFTAAIFVTVLIYTRTKSIAHRKDAAFSRWQPRTLNTADGFTLGNIFNKKQRAGFEKLATVEVSEDDEDGDDDDNDLNVRA